MTRNPITTEADEARQIAERIAWLDYGPARDTEIARLEAKGYTVLDIYNPRNHLCEPLASKVALLKGIFGIDDSGRCTRPPPPKAFVQQLFHYIMCGKIPPTDRLLTSTETARMPRKPTLASVAKQASKAAIAVARYELKPDGSIVIVTGQGEQQQGNEVDEWIAKHARAPERH
jgi:hypothetical protein